VISDEHVVEVQLHDTLGDLVFPHLYDLAISSCVTTSSFLESVILRHKDTLHRLTISNIHLITRDLKQFFQSIAGRLPNLRKVTLRGLSAHSGTWENVEYDEPLGATSPDNTLVRYDIESFVLNGGLVPAWGSHFAMGDADSADWGERIATKSEDCMRPSRPEDNTMADDPALDYAWDEFDDRF
jgi:hypothetical protein